MIVPRLVLVKVQVTVSPGCEVDRACEALVVASSVALVRSQPAGTVSATE